MATAILEGPQKPDAEFSLQSTPLFSGIAPETLSYFAERAIARTYPRGTMLFVHEEPAECFYVVMSGWVKLFRETLSGEEAIVDVLSRGHVFGENAVFDVNVYAYAAQVVEDAVLLSLPLCALQYQLQVDSRFAGHMLHVMSRHRKKQDKEIEHRDLQNAPQRIGCFLLRLCKPGALGSVKIHLPYDKTLIAARLGMKAETFSRALARLRNEMGMRIDGATVEIEDVARLSQYCCDACSYTYPCQDLP